MVAIIKKEIGPCRYTNTVAGNVALLLSFLPGQEKMSLSYAKIAGAPNWKKFFQSRLSFQTQRVEPLEEPVAEKKSAVQHLPVPLEGVAGKIRRTQHCSKTNARIFE